MTIQPSVDDWKRAALVCREVAELPDRTSADLNPDEMIVTGDELQPIVAAAIAEARFAGAHHAQSGWRPIETARDGQFILLVSDQGGISLVKWVKYGNDQWCKHGHSMPYLPVNWTHWMPLPEPPITEKEHSR